MSSFYYPELDDTKNQIKLINEEHHHLAHVLRCRQGDEININSGHGWFAKGKVVSVNKTHSLIDITKAIFQNQDLHFAIAFSLLRNKNDEWLVEKVTELGVTDLFPMTTQYSVRNPSKNTLSRFQQTALNAIKQCDNSWLPIIHDVQTLEQTFYTITKLGYIPVVTSEKRPDVWVNNLDTNRPLCFIIGPEGGFSEEEFIQFRKNDAQEITISSLILRAETAAIAIASQYVLLNR